MDPSIFLAKLFGLYTVIVCSAVLLRHRELPVIVDGFFRDPAFSLFSGAVILILGLLVVLSHNIWEMSYHGVITLFGWITLMKGVARLFLPHATLQSFARNAVKSVWYFPSLLAFLVLGTWLTAVGFGW